MSDFRKFLMKTESGPIASACYCIGPQRGEPYCPCAMRDKRVFRRDGRWIEPERDLGPVRTFDVLYTTDLKETRND